MNEDDWRIRGHMQDWLRNLTLVRKEWRQPRPTWDHDHCEFCFCKFTEGSTGYYAETDEQYGWICDSCFDDFKTRFNWTIGKTVD